MVSKNPQLGGIRLKNKIKVYMSGRNYNAEGFYNVLDGKLTVLEITNKKSVIIINVT